MRRLPSVVLLLAVLATAPGEAAHTSTREYVAGSGDAIVLLCSEQPSVGGACFGVPAAHSSARIRILDATGLPVGGAFRFEAADGAALTRGSFCRQTGTVAIPASAATLTVFVSSGRSALDCPPVNGEVPGAGTTGDVTVTWLGTAPSGGDTAPPVLAAGAAGVAGSGAFGASCISIAGAASHDAGRQRWSVSYWAGHPTPTTAGVCNEDGAHIHLTIECADAVGPEIFLSANGEDGRDYLVRIWDGIGEPDHAGVTEGARGPDRCGASGVAVTPVTEGAFAVVDVL